MEKILAIGVNPQIYNSQRYRAEEPEAGSSKSDEAASADISLRAKNISQQIRVSPVISYEVSTPKVDREIELQKRQKMLELLGPSIAERYTDLVSSVSNNNLRLQGFIEKISRGKELDITV